LFANSKDGLGFGFGLSFFRTTFFGDLVAISGACSKGILDG